jgi:hypothetical protein
MLLMETAAGEKISNVTNKKSTNLMGMTVSSSVSFDH